MAFPIALPWIAPAVGKGLAWGLGGLTALMTGKSIAENKDNIVKAASNAGDLIQRGALRRIGAASRYMSPRSSTASSPHYDRVGKPVAVSDATSGLIDRVINNLRINEGLVEVDEDSSINPFSTLYLEEQALSTSSKLEEQEPEKLEPDNKKPKDKKDKKPKRPFMKFNPSKSWKEGYRLGSYVGNAARVLLRDLPIAETVANTAWRAAGKIGESRDSTRVDDTNWNLVRYGNPYGWAYEFLPTLATKPKTSKSEEGSKSNNSTSNPKDSLPEGFVPIAGYHPLDTSKVVTYSSSGEPDSVVTLQLVPDISRFKRNGRNSNQ